VTRAWIVFGIGRTEKSNRAADDSLKNFLASPQICTDGTIAKMTEVSMGVAMTTDSKQLLPRKETGRALVSCGPPSREKKCGWCSCLQQDSHNCLVVSPFD